MGYNIGVSLKRSKDAKKDFTPIIALTIILTIIITFIIVFTSIRNDKCIELENKVMDEAFYSAKSLDILPTINGTSITIKLSDINSISFKNTLVGGTVKITKVNDNYIKTFDITNASYCTTSKRYKYSKSITKLPSKKNLIDVTALYNYKELTYNYSPWTDYYSSDKISTTIDSTYNVYLPLETKNYPKVSTVATILSYEVEEKTFYKYRDTRWKFYKNINNDYSDFSSEQPSGYSQMDKKTERKLPATEWSTSYPEVKSYRQITTATGYKWYYLDENKNKVYYNDGKYTPSIQDETDKEKYNKKEKETVTMYRYVDSEYRWYNGIERNYSSYMTQPNATYKYKDTELYELSSWSQYKDTSSINSTNSSYREETTDTHKRYRAYFTVASNLILDEYITLEELEAKLNRSIEEIINDKYIELSTTFTYKYGK